MNRKVAVIGAGPAGATAAYRLAQWGYDVDVFEASEHVGGLSRTIDLWGQRVDMGPHRFFSNDRRINALWLEVVGTNYTMLRRCTRILYRNRFFAYPLKPVNALTHLGPFEAVHCMWSYLVQKIRGKRTTNHPSFEDWMVAKFGRRLFEIFFKTYSEKLWGIPCTQLDADSAAQRIKTLSLFEAVKHAVCNGRGNPHKTLVDAFASPRGGTGTVYNKMIEFVEQAGGTIHLNMPVESVQRGGDKPKIVFANGVEKEFDHVISTMPLTQLVQRMHDVPKQVIEAASSLRFRNTILVFLEVEGTNHFQDNWLYIHSSDLQVGRITNFRNWCPSLHRKQSTTILALEYWSNFEDPLWQKGEDALIKLGTEELLRTKLTGTSKILKGHIERLSRCYPVYDKGYRDHVEVLKEFFSKNTASLTVIGRYGSFKYNNQDHSILMGLLAAENIAKGKQNDLWNINTDYESYQERATITESGLLIDGRRMGAETTEERDRIWA